MPRGAPSCGEWRCEGSAPLAMSRCAGSPALAMSSAYGLFTALQHATCHVPRYRDHGLLHRDHGTVVLCHPRCMRRYWLYSCRYHFPLNLLYFLAGDVPVFLASYEYLASARSTYLRPFDTDAFVSITGSARTDSCTVQPCSTTRSGRRILARCTPSQRRRSNRRPQIRFRMLALRWITGQTSAQQDKREGEAAQHVVVVGQTNAIRTSA